MSIPNAKQAQAFWLRAIGMSHKEISEVIGATPQATSSLIKYAAAKAKDAGLTYVFTPPVYEHKVGSGMMRAMEAVEEAGLKPKPKSGGFEELKRLAMEARLEGSLK